MASLTISPLLDERDIAKITNRSLASVRRDRLMKKGVPFLKLGSSVRYRPEDLTDWLATRPSGGEVNGRH